MNDFLHHKIRCRACGHLEILFYNVEDIENELMCCPDCGLVSHVHPRTMVNYNNEYVATRYDRYTTTEKMSRLRIRFIESALFLHESAPDLTSHSIKKGKLLDVGYGNGSFIREALRAGWDAYGNDINPTKYDKVRNVSLPTDVMSDRYRVITFFDSLEHFDRLQDVRLVSLNTDWIFVSYPKLPDADISKLKDWKHFRPGEHHHYFTSLSLAALFSIRDKVEASIRYVSNAEDAIRGRLPENKQNIETVGLRCMRTNEK